MAAAVLPGAAARAAVVTGAAPAFGARTALGLGAGVTDPRALAVADLDGDGRPDLVAGTANGGTGMVSVLRGTGGGAFASPLGNPFGLGATPGGIGALAVGDLNGDGRDDVLVAIGSGTAANDELVPLAGDGTGALSAGSAVAVPGHQLAGVALADLDDDGDLDALTASATAVSGEQLGVVQHTASGLVAVGSLGANGTSLARALAAGDLTGDGTPDALVVSATGGAWVVSSAGLTLTAGAPVAVGASDPVAVALADVDEDGDRDGLVLDGSANVLTVLRNDGAGHLTASSVLVDGLAHGTGLATGDLNGDGHADAVVTDGTTGRIGVLRGDGTGAFGTPTWAAAGGGARSPVVADLDGDGNDDLATADATGNTVSVLRNAGAPVPSGTLSEAFADQVVGSTGPARTVAIANTAGSARLRIAGVQTTGAAADDFLITGDACTGASVASGGSGTCAIRVRFAPSAIGGRTAALRVRFAGGGTYDVPLSATAIAGETPTPEDDSGDDDAATTATPAPTTTTTTTTTVTTPAAVPIAPATPVTPAPPVTPKPLATPKKTTRLILTLSLSKITARQGKKVRVGLALGRAAKLILRIKHAGRTVDVVRLAAHEGRSTVTWDGKLGKKPAPQGRYRIDVYAVAADGRAARASVALTIKP